MKSKMWLILVASLAVLLLAGSTGVTRSSFTDQESSVDNALIIATSSGPATEILRPNGVGSLTEIAYTGPFLQAHWSCVDEETPDDATTQVRDTTQAYHTDLYALPDTTLTGTINKVTVRIRVKGEDIVSYHSLAKEAIRTHGTNYFGIEHILATTWTDYSYEWTTNPYTGNPWTWDEINALEAGVSLGYQNVGYYSRCTQVYVEVSYTP